MDTTASRPDLRRHPTGLAIVVVMHALLACAIVSGLGRTIVEKAPVIDARLVPAAPPPPVPQKTLPLPTKLLLPPPLFVPPPTVEMIPSPAPSPNPPTTENDPAGIGTSAQPNDPPALAPSLAPRHATPAIIQSGDPSCRPEYPPDALRAGATGVSKIRFTVDASGKVTAAELIQSAGGTRQHHMLDRTAQSALAQCPITVGRDAGGVPVGTQVEVDYAWRID